MRQWLWRQVKASADDARSYIVAIVMAAIIAGLFLAIGGLDFFR